MSLEIQCMFMVHVKMMLGVVKKQNFSWNLINKIEWKVYTRNSTSYVFYINAYMLKLKIWLVDINWLLFINCVTTNWIIKQLTLWLHITGCRSLLMCLSHLIIFRNLFVVVSYYNENHIFSSDSHLSIWLWPCRCFWQKKKAVEWTFLDILILLTEKKNLYTVTSHLSTPFLYTFSSALRKSMPEHCNMWQDSPNWFCHPFLLLLHSR